MPLSTFDHTWPRSESWAMLVFAPGSSLCVAQEALTVLARSCLETLQTIEAAQRKARR